MYANHPIEIMINKAKSPKNGHGFNFFPVEVPDGVFLELLPLVLVLVPVDLPVLDEVGGGVTEDEVGGGMTEDEVGGGGGGGVTDELDGVTEEELGSSELLELGTTGSVPPFKIVDKLKLISDSSVFSKKILKFLKSASL